MKINISGKAEEKMKEYYKNEVPLKLVIQGVS